MTYTVEEFERAKRIEKELEQMYPNITLDDGCWMKERGNNVLHEESPDTYKQVTVMGNTYWKRIKVTPEQRAKALASAEKFGKLQKTINRDRYFEEGKEYDGL
jgi:hypothetical protein